MRRALSVMLRKPLAPALVFAALFALAVAVGKPLYDMRKVGGWYAVRLLLLFTACLIVSFLLFQLLRHALIHLRATSGSARRISSPKAWLIAWALFFLCWVPCLLAYYPGVFSYDIPKQTVQFFTGDFNTDQPLVHTLFWGLCIQVASWLPLEPVTIYALLQMAFLSFAFARAVKHMVDRKMPAYVVVVTGVFFACMPTIALMSIIPTKDVLLAGFLVLLVICTSRMLGDAQSFFARKRNVVQMCLLALACCLLRENMVYAVALSAVILAVALRKAWEGVVVALLGPALLCLVFSGPVLGAAGIVHTRNWEAFSVPMQQVAYVSKLHEDELSEEDKQAISENIPFKKMVSKFNLRFADPVKSLFTGNDKASFMKIWLSLGTRYPADYLYEFLELNIPYWYPLASSVDPYSKRDYIETAIYDCDYYTFERDSAFPQALELYEKIAAGGSIAGSIVFAPLFSISAPLWVLVFCICMFFALGKKHEALVCLLPALYWLTFMFGPVSNFRYVFPLMCLYPLLFGYLVAGTGRRPFAEPGCQPSDEEDRA